jgi:hypothetical protein
LGGSETLLDPQMSKKRTTVDVVAEFRQLHGDLYDYSVFEYRGIRSLGNVICREHGPFAVTPINHRRGSGCPICSETIKSKCKRLGVNYHRALKRRQAGMPDDVIFAPEYIREERAVGKVEVFDREYPNLKAAVRELKPPAPRETIGRWIRAGMSPEEAFGRIPNPGVSEGLIYLVTNDLTGKKYVGLTVQTLERRWTYHLEQAAASNIQSDVSLHAAIREFGAASFAIAQIDQGMSKVDLEEKERHWIKNLKTLVPNGYNITLGGESGGSNKQPKEVDGIVFPGAREAAMYISESRGIGFEAAKARLRKGRIDVRTPSPPGQAVTKTAAYRAWSNIVHGSLNVNSKDYVGDVGLENSWKEFDGFLRDVGQPDRPGLCFARIDKTKGFHPNNGRWMSKQEASRINAAYMKQNGLLVGRRGKSSGL